jgi:inorganic pyrophosphatase
MATAARSAAFAERAALQERIAMDITRIPPGIDPPRDINVIIEIPQGGAPVKYEFDKEWGVFRVDRFLPTAMFYPANYGFIPQTLSPDGDPCDVPVVAPMPVMPGAVLRARPVGALVMKDEAGIDEKILAVPVEALDPFQRAIRSYRDLSPLLCEQIAHFFQHHKDLEPGKWVEIERWADAEEAQALVRRAIDRAAAQKAWATRSTPRRRRRLR